MPESLNKLIREVRFFADTRGENYWQAIIEFNNNFGRQPVYKYVAYVHGFGHHEGRSIAEAMASLRHTPIPENLQNLKDEDLSF